MRKASSRHDESQARNPPEASPGALISPYTQMALGMLLTAIAGYVDAIGYVELGGLFASFMSGASVSLGVGTSECHWGAVFQGILLIAAFLCGAIAATVVSGTAGLWALPMVLLLEGAFLAGAAAMAMAEWPASIAIFPVVAAMGVQNTALRPVNGVRLGVTFITGTLVSLGQGLGNALLRRNPWGWGPHALVWFAFCVGAATGAALYFMFGFIAVAAPAAGVVLMSVAVAIAAFMERRRVGPN